MLQGFIKFIGLLLIITAIGLTLEYSSFTGSQGSGYSIGFTLSIAIILAGGVGVLLLIKSEWVASRFWKDR